VGPGDRPSSKLTGEERVRLLNRVGSDRAAGERLLEAYLGLVVRLARERADQGLELDDLVQDGSEGLARAIPEYRPGEHGDFDAYAAAAVAASMDQALARERAAVEEERRLVTAAEDYERVELLLARELKRRPTPSEMAAKLEWDLERVGTIGDLVADARRRHDQELIAYLDPDEELARLLEQDQERRAD